MQKRAVSLAPISYPVKRGAGLVRDSGYGCEKGPTGAEFPQRTAPDKLRGDRSIYLLTFVFGPLAFVSGGGHSPSSSY